MQFLEHQQDTALSLQSIEHAAIFNDLRALLEYLHAIPNPDTAADIYDGFIATLEKRALAGPTSTTHEITLLRKFRLLYLHSTTAKPFKPAVLRQALETALTTFSQNTAFLSLYSWNEARTKIENRVRAIIRDRVLDEGKESVAGWVFAVWVELRMGANYNVHAVRSLLERAVTCTNTKASPQLWALLIEFELRMGDSKRARNAFMRGTHNCPWSKGMNFLRRITGAILT